MGNKKSRRSRLLITTRYAMPTDGLYSRQAISVCEAKKLFLVHKQNYKSFLNSGEVCKMFANLTGEWFAINLSQIQEANPEDVVLLLEKTHNTLKEGYVFFKIYYYAKPEDILRYSDGGLA